ncbi:MAG: T9SS type A sorting domain-containing protein [Ignavibacteria bacterium]|jgi:hypothetical protein|nr:T9SS type A sorting domain-containing protein [Ignavibacteria bacterium]
MKHFVFVWVCLLLMSTVAEGKSIVQDSLLNFMAKYASAAGNEFWFSFPPCYEEVAGAENTTRVFVVSQVRQPVTVEVQGKGWASTKMAPANEVLEFKLPTNVGQPYSKSTLVKAPKEQIYSGAGIHVTSISPIVVYGISRFQYTSDGFLAIPVSGLGQDYVIASWPQYTAAGSSFELPALSNIVAAFDDTEVTFTMGGTSGSKTTGGLRSGQTKKWMLNAGDVICIANDDDGQDIAGSRVVASKPVGVISGNQCANIPEGVPWCDFTAEMELPTTTWGKEYHVPALIDRLNNPIIRIFAHPDYKNVKIYRDGKEWLVLPNNSRIENQAFAVRRLQDGPPKSTLITADAPIYVMLYNPGQGDDNVASDPFQCVISPVEQYQKEIIFSTPNAKGGTLPFTVNYLNIVYALNEKDSIPQDLEFAVVNNGKFEWRSVASRFGVNPGQIFSASTSNGLKYGMKRIILPGDGVYSIRAKQPFAAYSYGYSDYDSYGFPASVALGDLTKMDTMPPIPAYKVLCDGSAQGIDGKLPVVNEIPHDANIRSNLAIIYMDIDPDSSYNYEFKVVDEKGKPTKIIPGISTKIYWTLKVVNPAKDAQARIVFVDKAGNDTSIIVTYEAFPVSFNSQNIDFGYTYINTPYARPFKVTNTSDTSMKISRLECKSNTEGFVLTEKNGLPIMLPFTLTSKQEKEFNVVFNKGTIGEFVDSIGIGNECQFFYSIELSCRTMETDTKNPIADYIVQCDGSVKSANGLLAYIKDLPDTPVRSNLANVYLDLIPDSSYNYEFTTVDENGNPMKIVAGVTSKVYWTLKVNNPRIDARARIAAFDNVGNDTAFVIRYSPFKGKIDKNNLQIGMVKYGDRASIAFDVNNTSKDDIIISRFEFKKKNQGFTISELDGSNLKMPFTLPGLSKKQYLLSCSNNSIGEYEDSLGIGDDCQFYYTTKTQVQVTTSVSDNNENQNIRIYPNPVKKLCTVDGLTGENTIMVLNVLGEVKMKHITQETKSIISFESLASGNYSVLIRNSKGICTLPLVIVE